MYKYSQIKTIHLEITSKCNASCPMCGRNICGGAVNPHLPLTELSLNDIKQILPLWFKKEVVKKFEDFYPWLEKEQKNYKDFKSNAYGIKRLKGMCQFMLSEDWSNRLPEFQEYILRMDRIRGTDFKKTFPEMAELLKSRSVSK